MAWEFTVEWFGNMVLRDKLRLGMIERLNELAREGWEPYLMAGVPSESTSVMFRRPLGTSDDAEHP